MTGKTMSKRPGKVVGEKSSGEAAGQPRRVVAVRRFIGVHSLTHAGTIYQAGPDGILKLPEADTWYHPLVESGVLTEVEA